MLMLTLLQDQEEAITVSRVILAGNSLAQPDLTGAEEDKKPVCLSPLLAHPLSALLTLLTRKRNATVTTRRSTPPSPPPPSMPSSASYSLPSPSTSCPARTTLPHQRCLSSRCILLCCRAQMASRDTTEGRTLGGVKWEGLGEFGDGMSGGRMERDEN